MSQTSTSGSTGTNPAPSPKAILKELPPPRETTRTGPRAIFQALERNGGDKPKTASELGIALKTLYNRLNQSALQSEAG